MRSLLLQSPLGQLELTSTAKRRASGDVLDGMPSSVWPLFQVVVDDVSETGCPSGSLASLGSSYLIAATTVRAGFLLARETVCRTKCFRMKGTTASTACIISGKTS
ncbi:MAG: hypothetical protein QOE55_257 [Acidobacteriaceae bacterium]|nr:hypothetical protein [Acidobacteriaceae bacterium]